MTNQRNGVTYQNYSTIISTVTVVALFVAGFWGAVIMPMQGELRILADQKLTIGEHNEFKSRVNQELADLASLKVAVAEHTEFKTRLDKELIAMTQTIKEVPTRLELKPYLSDLDNMKASVVGRGEHVERWRSIDQQMAEVNKQIESVRAQFGTAYTLGDEVKRLQHDIDLLRVGVESTPKGSGAR
jgi:DNA repair exonuclease SbcCD ATPase subunit